MFESISSWLTTRRRRQWLKEFQKTFPYYSPSGGEAASLRLVLGTARSGTSWVSKVLAHSGRKSRFLCEPLFHIVPKLPYHKKPDHTATAYEMAPELSPLLAAYSLMAHREYDAGRSFVLERNDPDWEICLVKEVHALLGTELVLRHFRCPTIFILRNPLYIADSLFAAQTLETHYFNYELESVQRDEFLTRFAPGLEDKVKRIFADLSRRPDRERIVTSKMACMFLMQRMFAQLSAELPFAHAWRYNDVCRDPQRAFQSMAASLSLSWDAPIQEYLQRTLQKDETSGDPYSIMRDTATQASRPLAFLTPAEVSSCQRLAEELPACSQARDFCRQMIFVFFSKDRPLQLDAALRSLRQHSREAGSAQITVLYKASGTRMLSLYRQLSREHPSVSFVRETNFARDLRILLRGHNHIGFVVDDSVFIRDFSLIQVIASLDRHPDALGFSMRLGKNTTSCYSLNRPQKIPALVACDEFVQFRWPEGECDFGYPLELSSSIYRAAEILPLLETIEFNNPNTLENSLHASLGRFQKSHPILLCAQESLAFSIPANLTQSLCDNRFANRPDYSTEALAALFARGRRIDLGPISGMLPAAAHQEVEWRFFSGGPAVPLVSVVVPCYNQAQYLPEAIASVIAQTLQDFEIIIVNDGSTDATAQQAAGLIARYPAHSIRVLHKTNEGLAMARNDGIREAAGAFVLPLDADDTLDPSLLEKAAAILQARPGVAIVYTDVLYFGSEEKVIRAEEFDFRKICRNNQLNYCSLFRWETWEAAGGYNANMIWGYEDWDFWISCGELGLCANKIPEPLFHYRVKPHSMFASAMKHDQELRARMMLNHPRCFEEGEITASRAIWGDSALPLPNHAPKVSVIIPTYNRPALLEEALRSVLAQTFEDFEIIVVNDNGVDIFPVLARVGTSGRIFHLRHAANRGLAAARNTGRRFARGKYIAFLDDDDIFLPQHLEILVRHLESTGAKAAYTDAYRAIQKVEQGQVRVERAIAYSKEWDSDGILVRNFVPVLCFLHERACGIAAGGLDESLTTHEDWDFWIRLSRLCQPIHISQVTCEFRVPPDNSSMTTRLGEDFVRSARIIYRKYHAYSHGKKHVLQGQQQFLRDLRRHVRGQRRHARKRWWKRFRQKLLGHGS